MNKSKNKTRKHRGGNPKDYIFAASKKVETDLRDKFEKNNSLSIKNIVTYKYRANITSSNTGKLNINIYFINKNNNTTNHNHNYNNSDSNNEVNIFNKAYNNSNKYNNSNNSIEYEYNDANEVNLPNKLNTLNEEGPKSNYIINDIDAIWFGCGTYSDINDNNDKSIGNTLLVIKGSKLTYISSKIIEFELMFPDENITNYISTLEDDEYPSGWIESNKGIYAIKDLNCKEGFLHNKNIPPKLVKDCWEKVKPLPLKNKNEITDEAFIPENINEFEKVALININNYNYPRYTNLNYNSNLSGSTGAKLYKNKSDKKWVVKKSYGNFAQVKSEYLANMIYKVLGVPVPRQYLDIENKALILEYIDGTLLKDVDEKDLEKVKKQLQQHFIVDALLANWDIIGLKHDNIIVPADGSPPIRIDNGGALLFKAQGEPKNMNEDVVELYTMRNKTIAPEASSIFGDITENEINNQIKEIIKPNYKKILNIIPKNNKKLINIMKKRLDNLIGMYDTSYELSVNNIKNIINNNNKGEITNIKLNNLNFNNNAQYKANKYVNLVNKVELNKIDVLCINTYTDSMYDIINMFLYESSDKLDFPLKYLNYIQFILDLFPKGAENDEIYNQKMLYLYFVNLYNAIQKGPKSKMPFVVYRGAYSTYLKEDSSKFYYINSFSSTSIIKSEAMKFSNYIVYIFYIDPLCTYMNITNLSYHKGEKEILLTPYHRYIYVKSHKIGNTTYYTYVILPSDLDIPNTFEEFIPWKDTVAEMSREFHGGRVKEPIRIENKPFINHMTKQLNNKFKTVKQSFNKLATMKKEVINSKNIKTIIKTNKSNKTVKNKLRSDKSLNRFTEPIPSFPGKTLTSSEKERIQQILKFFEK